MASSHLAGRESESGAGPQGGPGFVFCMGRIPWHLVAYGLLFLTALIMRLWDLDARTYHYDETIHAFDSWQLFNGNGYMHSPWSHGPLLYHASAISIFLFGDNWVSPRLVPALFGAALVVTPWFLRHRIGVWGSIVTAAMLAFSPSILYFSRFLRNDILSLVFDMALIISMWRYIETRENRWLVLGALALSLGFSSKETTFISLGIIILFLAAWELADSWPTLGRWIRRSLRVRSRRPEPPSGGVPGAPVVHAASWTGEGEQIRGRVTPALGFLVFVLALTLPLFAAIPGWVFDNTAFSFQTVVMDAALPATQVGAPDGSWEAYTLAGVIVGVLFIVGGLSGYLWKGKTFLLAWCLFYIVFFSLHTTFFTNVVGFGTGVWQSLGYWIAQQPVERGSQPWYYYLIHLPVYEFLPFFFGILAFVAYGLRRRLEFLTKCLACMAITGLIAWGLHIFTGNHSSLDKLFYVPIAFGGLIVTTLALRRGDRFEWFLVHWFGFSLLAYIAAGEKMPWLLTHMALPLVFLAGKFIGEMITVVPWRAVVRTGSIGLVLLGPIVLGLIYALTTSVPWTGNEGGVWSFIAPLVVSGLVVAVAIYAGMSLGVQRTLAIGGISVVVLMAGFTVRTALETTYVNGDNADELIVYSQLAPDVQRTVLDIERIAETSRKGEDLRILADASDAAVAPWRWYLRKFPQVQHVDFASYEGDFDHDVILVNPRHDKKLVDVRDSYEDPRRITFLTWFNPFEVYDNYSPGQFWDDVRSGSAWNKALRYFTYREIGTDSASQDVIVYFNKDLF